MLDPRAIIRDRIATLGLRLRDVAERVAPLWKLAQRDAESKIAHYLAGERDINSTAFVQLCAVLAPVVIASER